MAEVDLNGEMVGRLVRVLKYGLALVLVLLNLAGYSRYGGSLPVYVLYVVLANLILFWGFRRNALFFDTFIGVFFWLGFGLKFAIRMCLGDRLFVEAVGQFDYSGAAYDRALLVSSCGLAALMLASLVRERLFFSYPDREGGQFVLGFHRVYAKYRYPILAALLLLMLAVPATNAWLGIYQRGELTRYVLPFGLNGLFKWLLLFGLASFSTLVIRCELALGSRIPLLTVLLALFETFASNVSMLSRGMILNGAALFFGTARALKSLEIKLNLRTAVLAMAVFSALFIGSVHVVNYLRASTPEMRAQPTDPDGPTLMNSGVNRGLILDRWVGLEAVMAVSSSPRLGWGLLSEALQEKYAENVMGFYDKNLITSPYADVDFSKKHSISLPGVVAFLFYPGSYLFLFGAMFALGLFAAFIEWSAYRFGGGNLIFCSLVSEVVAYRFLSFGYVPMQSYLLFGAIFLNIAMFGLIQRISAR